ncbi:hypothetical protein FRC04_005179 [Tulasnella sp. 424]|nr:hypothetical protein FRC04_005179 [Tulasnella sp. 424]KAG8963059.1 hypothetical protein FRC05_004941 [Tulasnella sp. 425]
MATQILSEACPPKSKFEPSRDIPDLSDKVVIVTGGNTGIGKETIRELLKKNAKVYMASRSKSKAEAAIEDLKTDTGKEAIFLELDLADLSSVTKSANEFKSKEKALHILFNSGGIMNVPIDQMTSNGFDAQWGTNCLGHAHFTMCLIPELLEGAKTSSDGKARVINTASDGAYWAPKEGIIWETLRDGEDRRKLTPMKLYFQSKFGNYAFSCELAKRFGDQGIISNALNPGHLKTDLQRHGSRLEGALTSWMLFPAPMGALTQLWLGTSPETVDFNGKWAIPWAREGKFLGPSNVEEVGPKLWEWVEEQRKDFL